MRQRHRLAALAAATLLSLTRSTAIASSGLLIDIAFGGRAMPPGLEASAMEETSRIWGAYGVNVRAIGRGDPGRDGAVRLWVVLAARLDERAAAKTLGSIRFIDGVPEHRITIYPDAIATLVSSPTLSGIKASQLPAGLRETILGRVLGRALAHEIGHFLLRSPKHSPTGLMRPVQALPDLVSSDRERFSLSSREAAFVASESPRE